MSVSRNCKKPIFKFSGKVRGVCFIGNWDLENWFLSILDLYINVLDK